MACEELFISPILLDYSPAMADDGLQLLKHQLEDLDRFLSFEEEEEEEDKPQVSASTISYGSASPPPLQAIRQPPAEDERAVKRRITSNNDYNKRSRRKNPKLEVPAAPAPTGFIHVRARRGEATDSHSLAERVRRGKITERMRVLQGLVPGCDKSKGKQHVLDEIINYVRSLQNQIEFLSTKIASLGGVLHALGFNSEDYMNQYLSPEAEEITMRMSMPQLLQSQLLGN